MSNRLLCAPAVIIPERTIRRLTDAELATLDMPFIQRPDTDDSNTRPVIGWLLLAVVIGAALAVWVLV